MAVLLHCRVRVIDAIERFDVNAMDFPSYLSEETQVRVCLPRNAEDLLRGLLQHDSAQRLTSAQVLVVVSSKCDA